MVLEEDLFVPEIMVVPFPKGFKQLLIESYDGVIDPVDHLWTFIDMMGLYFVPDALSQSFVAYFLSSKRKRKTAIGLMQVMQEKEKTLQDYLARFSRAMLEIKDLQMSAVVTTIMNGTWNRSFKMSLSKNTSESIQELLRKGDKYVNVEEAERVTKSLHDGRESETNKRTFHENQRLRDDKGKQKGWASTFFGYHQIFMVELDQENTSFITDFGTNCYIAMPFGLKNAGATYQRMVNKVFVGYIGKVIEAFVDDMVVKSARLMDHMIDLKKSI
ncbi:RNA-directed DNA polymerase like [Abeliophyllum distichum]|uniref:RNA-directed DNA polymerase like n=1 Tax=Abeliophyllum distichum TaxID=126358 RepID=A0ABD1RTC6_9LAMI